MIKFRHIKEPAVPHEPKVAPKYNPGQETRFCSMCHGQVERIPAHAATRGARVVPS